MSMCRWCNLGHKYCACQNSDVHVQSIKKDGSGTLRKITTKLANFSPKTLEGIRRVKNEPK